MLTEPSPARGTAQPWWRELTRYHWFVFVVAALGWLADCMDQQIFVLARARAMKELVTPLPGETAEALSARQVERATWATSIFLIGWATGGIAFGILGDRWGRAKTMILTILIYSIFTGLSALSQGFWDFALYRFLTGLGVGGEFAVGVALLAEVMPDRARPFALGWLQSLSAVGNVTAAVISMTVVEWRWMFVAGTAPALLALIVRGRLKEPERWRAVAADDGVRQQLGSIRELFGDPRWRRNALVGLALASSGVIGLWGIGFFSYDLQQLVFSRTLEARGLAADEVKKQVTMWVGIASIFQNGGGFLGIHAFSWFTHRTSRRLAFGVAFIAAALSTALTFAYLGKVFGFYDVFWMIPLMGFCQLALFGGYAIYFPELFPTRLRSTGTSFCYNVGRYVAAVGPFGLGLLTSRVFAGTVEPMRPAGVTMCACFLVGLLALPFAPETKGRPLPE
jgi:MFS family permease